MSEFRTLEDAFSYVRVLQKPIVDPKPHKIWKERPRVRIDGGDPVRTPVNRVAARVVAPAPWWAMPPEVKQQKPLEVVKPKKRKKKMSNSKSNDCGGFIEVSHTPNIPGQSYTSDAGVRVTFVNGEPMFRADDIMDAINNQIAKLPKETRPNVMAAQDARQIIHELTAGIGGEMEKFKADTKRYLEDIRATRFAMVTEASQMTGPLKEVRQFFLGGDYREEMARLKEFVEVCERLHALKESGFLDNVADTMLRLAK